MKRGIEHRCLSLKFFCQLEPEGKRMMQQAYDRYQYSARTFHKFLKVAMPSVQRQVMREVIDLAWCAHEAG
ncbi:hypothetical protein [Anoxynatronum sibiricum]|uniref:Mg chelatase-related protein C-terminal domain-containing protein n=1 Tax=Anoxynatronum sibiricum TaxID=210623 RepID=A0ABU9VUB7_9CLOT